LQAKIDSKLTWEEFQREVQTQLSGSITGFWRLYEARCHLVQRRQSLAQGEDIARMIVGRSGFDSGALEMAKARSRIARRRDAVLEAERIVNNQQIILIQSVGSPALCAHDPLELIPSGMPVCPPVNIPIREAVVTGMSHRPEVRSAALDLESAALAVAISRRDLLPKLDAVVSGYLAGLNGDYDVGRSFTDQFRNDPGASFGVVMERPVGNRAAKSKLRASQQHYLELAERYRDAVSNTASEIALALKNLETLVQQSYTKAEILSAAALQESLIRQRWETLGTDGRYAALVLEDLLEQQELRTAAEADFVSNQVNYLLALVELHRAMGTLLVAEGLEISRPTDHTQEVAIPTHPVYTQFVDPQTIDDGMAGEDTSYSPTQTR
jgi:outer membrane protein TolC